MDDAPQYLSNLPLAAWILLLAVVAFAGRYATLCVRWRRFRADGLTAERNLVEVASRLREYAFHHLQQLPARLEEVSPGLSRGVAYRPVSRLTLDGRLVLLHDERPSHKLLQFPQLRDGRGLVLCNGRLLIVSEEAFEKLLQADDALRQRLGLEPVSADEVTENRHPERA